MLHSARNKVFHTMRIYSQFLKILACRFGKTGVGYNLAVLFALGTKAAIQVIAWDRGVIPDSVRIVLGAAIILMAAMAYTALGDYADVTKLADERQVPFENVLRFYVGWWNGYWADFRLFRQDTWATPAFVTAAQADLTMGIHSAILHPTTSDQPAAN